MYDALVKRLITCATEAAACKVCDMRDDGSCTDTLMKQAADAIEKLNSQVESLCETIDLYHKLLDGHPDPRGEDGEPGIKCIDCQMDCQMIGLDIPACTAYVPPKEEA